MNIIKIIFLFVLIVGVLFGSYYALFNKTSDFITAATGNDTFVAGVAPGFPVIYIVVIIMLVLGVIVYALKRRAD